MRAIPLYAPALLCLVGLLLSFEYQGEQHRALLWVFRVLAIVVAIAGAVLWFAALPPWANIAVNIAALAVNLPLAAFGLKKQ